MHIEELETPAIVVDLDVLERNISSLADYCRRSNLNLRPHTKTHKIPEIARMQVNAGSRGITVAKVGEAEVMAAAGMDDILVHYPIFGRSKLERLAYLARDRKIILAIDSVITAEAISNAAASVGSTIHLLVEFDSGLHRCGVESPEAVENLAHVITRLPNVTFAGISTFPGHIWSDPAEQALPLAEVSAMIADIKDRLQHSGLACEIVSAGSTPIARNSHLIEGVTETRPGTYVFNDRNTAGVGACTWDDCALHILVTREHSRAGPRNRRRRLKDILERSMDIGRKDRVRAHHRAPGCRFRVYVRGTRPSRSRDLGLFSDCRRSADHHSQSRLPLRQHA